MDRTKFVQMREFALVNASAARNYSSLRVRGAKRYPNVTLLLLC
jgi:hypothetical protein